MLIRKSLSRVVLTLVLTFLLTSTASATGLPFTDVPAGAWYYDDVKTAYQTKLINGKSKTLYAPNDNMTAAEAVKLAACMHQLKNEGRVDFPLNATPWYKPYVDYAREKNLITADLAWNSKINRAGYMEIFAKIITGAEANLNNIEDGAIPDVAMTHPNANSIYKLYRAGIVQGVDTAGNCNPESFIKRSEVAAILTRMMNESRRISSNLEKLKITQQPQNVTGRLGEDVQLQVIASGGKAPLKYQWQYLKDGETEFKNSTFEGNNTNILKLSVPDIIHEYRCIITDANGKQVISDKAKVEKKSTDTPFSIIKQPDHKNGRVGEKVQLEFDVKGGKAPLKYQWQYIEFGTLKYYDSKAEGNTTNILRVPVEETIYDYRCVVTDAAGNILISKTARVKKDAASDTFSIINQPKDVAADIWETAVLEVRVTGGKKPLKYQWQFIEFGTSRYYDSEKEGNTTNRLKTPVYDIVYDYRCIITDADGKKLISDTVRVEKGSGAFAIIKHPINTKGRLGTDVELEVITSGGRLPITYQWKYAVSYGSFTSTYVNSKAPGNKTNLLTVPVEVTPYKYYCEVMDADGNKLNSQSALVIGSLF